MTLGNHANNFMFPRAQLNSRHRRHHAHQQIPYAIHLGIKQDLVDRSPRAFRIDLRFYLS